MLDFVRSADRGAVLQRPISAPAGMCRNRDAHAADIVGVVALRELMAKSGSGIGHERAAALPCRVSRIDFDLNRVVPRWNGRLSVTPVEHEVLAAQLPHVGVRPSVADPLKAVMYEGTAAPVVPGPVAGADVVRIGIEHAEPALGRLPLFSIGVEQPIGSVILEVKMCVT